MHVLIADDHGLLRDTLGFLFEQEKFVVTTAADLDTTLKALYRNDAIDVVLLDYGMPGMNRLEGLTRVIAAAQGAKVALMSGIATRDVVQLALDIGAVGFLPKSLSARTFVNAVRFMAMGEKYLPLEFMAPQDEADVDHPLIQNLSKREREVLQLLATGQSNKEIARVLGLQEPTIKLHVTALYRKLGSRNRAQAAVIAKEAGLC